MARPSLVELAGGPLALERVLEDFYGRVFADRMIGFFFREADRSRLVAKELELVRACLGEDLAYSGQPLAAVHARHPIQGGQFMRRHQLLKETLHDQRLPPEVCERWLSHDLELRPEITADLPEECEPRGKPGHPG